MIQIYCAPSQYLASKFCEHPTASRASDEESVEIIDLTEEDGDCEMIDLTVEEAEEDEGEAEEEEPKQPNRDAEPRVDLRGVLWACAKREVELAKMQEAYRREHAGSFLRGL